MYSVDGDRSWERWGEEAGGKSWYPSTPEPGPYWTRSWPLTAFHHETTVCLGRLHCPRSSNETRALKLSSISIHLIPKTCAPCHCFVSPRGVGIGPGALSCWVRAELIAVLMEYHLLLRRTPGSRRSQPYSKMVWPDFCQVECSTPGPKCFLWVFWGLSSWGWNSAPTLDPHS